LPGVHAKHSVPHLPGIVALASTPAAPRRRRAVLKKAGMAYCFST